MPNQICVAVREPRPLPCADRTPQFQLLRGTLADGERRSGVLCQALFRVDIQVAFDAQRKNIPQGKHVPSQTG